MAGDLGWGTRLWNMLQTVHTDTYTQYTTDVVNHMPISVAFKSD